MSSGRQFRSTPISTNRRTIVSKPIVNCLVSRSIRLHLAGRKSARVNARPHRSHAQGEGSERLIKEN